jgi:hypothetical protein
MESKIWESDVRSFRMRADITRRGSEKKKKIEFEGSETQRVGAVVSDARAAPELS